MDLRQEVQKHARRYKRYRDNDQLIQGEWRTDEEDGGREDDGKFGPVYACALGAFLKAEHDGHAAQVGCVAHMMPEWLVEATPEFFDHTYNETGFHIKWADALYMPGGIVARASKLAESQREKLYDAAEKEIRRRYGCQYVAAGNEAEDWYNYRADPFQNFIRASQFMTPEEAAGTIINVLDELLTEAGA